ncbi:MAG: 50S ribosomal protein L10 [Bryobacteraceae bacterium]|nr:50S ribosomal protein L10 [Bryobacteraceae bacterium]
MSLNRSEKQAVIDEVSALAAKAQTLVMAEYRGITVADLTKLRVEARKAGVSLSVLKNTLARRAVAGTPFEVAVERLVPASANLPEAVLQAGKKRPERGDRGMNPGLESCLLAKRL